MDGIIVGVDESDGAAAALRWAVAEAGRSGQPVTAVMAWSYRDQHGDDPAASFDLDYGSDDAARDLDGIVERALGAAGSVVARRALRGNPSDVLLDASHRAGVLVIGARGMGGFRGLLLGSVSRDVLYGSACPVVVVREESYDDGGPVVVGVDGSETARAALRWGLAHAKLRGGPLVALHACQPVQAGDFVLDVPSDERLGRELLERELGAVDTSGLETTVEARVLREPAAPALVEASGTASLVVVGTRGRRPLAGLFLGSVSDHVAHHARCPVAVVPSSATLARHAAPAVADQQDGEG
jgi:nucleotide-binding universal stress UspA family protein